MKKFIASVLAFGLIFSTQAFADVTRFSMNFRSEPSVGDNIICGIPQGTEVKLISSSGDWDCISYNGRTGYIHSGNIVSSVKEDEKEGTPGAAAVLNGNSATSGTAAGGSAPASATGQGNVVNGTVPASAAASVPAPATAQAAAGSATAAGTASRAGKLTTRMNLRKEPSTGAEILDVMPKGSQLTWLSNSNGWDKVVYNNKVGYVMQGRIKFKGAAQSHPSQLTGSAAAAGTSTGTPAQAPAAAAQSAVIQDSMNLRSEAGMNGTILDVVPVGSTVTWLSSSNGWDKISWNGKTGWVKSGVLKTQNGPVA